MKNLQRIVNIVSFFIAPLYCLPPFSKFVQPPLTLSVLTPTNHCSFFGWMLCLNGWSPILYNNIMDLQMTSLGTLVPEGPSCVFYATNLGVLIHNVFFCWYLIWYHTHTCTNTLTHKDTQRSLGPVDLHTHKNIYLHHLLCAHRSYLYYIEWIILWCQKITFVNVFSFQQLFT